MVESPEVSVVTQIDPLYKSPRDGFVPVSPHGLTVGGGTKGISEFVGGLRLAARTIAGGKETSKHKRRRSGLPPLESTLALGYTYIDIIDEENDGASSRG